MVADCRLSIDGLQIGDRWIAEWRSMDCRVQISGSLTNLPQSAIDSPSIVNPSIVDPPIGNLQSAICTVFIPTRSSKVALS
jgi:hypothetical protein